MNSTWIVSLSLLIAISACSPVSKFKAGVNQRDLEKSQNATPGPSVPRSPEDPAIDGQINGESTDLDPLEGPKPVIEAKLSLDVLVSAVEVRAGKKPIQAEAIFKPAAPAGAVIIWTLEGPAGIDLGSIDSSGKYLSPAKVDKELAVSIVATLESDRSVTAKKAIKVIPAEQLFVGCKKGNLTFPISADVFTLPVGTSKLPDFSTMIRDDIVCLDKYDIPLQSWEVGFPGSPALQENFALHSKAKLNIARAGEYVFRIYSDDGAILYINGNVIVNNDGTHSAITKDAKDPLTLSAGKHDIVVDYYQGPRTHVALQLYWKVPDSSEFVIVPASVFSAE
ncbi:MAG: hypothetical protein EOP10_02805 [Proteobacteria bacterium]|nr:MAG: hypothetical protein EOP10_02805 [Pseudomonadota bacterium]